MAPPQKDVNHLVGGGRVTTLIEWAEFSDIWFSNVGSVVTPEDGVRVKHRPRNY